MSDRDRSRSRSRDRSRNNARDGREQSNIVEQETEEDLKRKLFIGNLGYNTNESDLLEAFQKCGQIMFTRVMTEKNTGMSRGFGFVSFSTIEEADYAFETMQGSLIHNRAIRIDRSTPKNSTKKHSTRVQQEQAQQRGRDNRGQVRDGSYRDKNNSDRNMGRNQPRGRDGRGGGGRGNSNDRGYNQYSPNPSQNFNQSYDNDQSYTGGGGRQQQSGNNICFSFQRGFCKYGDRCQYSHVQGQSIQNDSGGGGRLQNNMSNNIGNTNNMRSFSNYDNGGDSSYYYQQQQQQPDNNYGTGGDLQNNNSNDCYNSSASSAVGASSSYEYDPSQQYDYHVVNSAAPPLNVQPAARSYDAGPAYKASVAVLPTAPAAIVPTTTTSSIPNAYSFLTAAAGLNTIPPPAAAVGRPGIMSQQSSQQYSSGGPGRGVGQSRVMSNMPQQSQLGGAPYQQPQVQVYNDGGSLAYSGGGGNAGSRMSYQQSQPNTSNMPVHSQQNVGGQGYGHETQQYNQQLPPQSQPQYQQPSGSGPPGYNTAGGPGPGPGSINNAVTPSPKAAALTNILNQFRKVASELQTQPSSLNMQPPQQQSGGPGMYGHSGGQPIPQHQQGYRPMPKQQQQPPGGYHQQQQQQYR